MFLKRGSRNVAVRKLQGLLRLPVDGIFGGRTEYALKAYQQRSGLAPDGIVGPQTWASLISDRTADSFKDTFISLPQLKLDLKTLHLHIQPLLGTVFSNTEANKQKLIRGLRTLVRLDLLDYLELNTRLKVIHFLAQMREEVGRNIHLIENLNYQCKVLPPLFSYYGRNKIQARQDGRCRGHSANQRNIANKAYGGRMGNKPYPSEDGWNKRGRGSHMVTGTDNYNNLDKDIKRDLPELYLEFKPATEPDKLADMDYWLVSGAMYWKKEELYRYANSENPSAVDDITRIINRRTHSYASRRKHFNKLKQIFV